jgi:hypothetical protein
MHDRLRQRCLVILHADPCPVARTPALCHDLKQPATNPAQEAFFIDFDWGQGFQRPYCNVPFVVISSQGSRCALQCPKLRPYEGLQRDLRPRGYSHSTVSELHVKLLNRTTALANAVFVRHKTDGSELETIGATYILRKTEGKWKIAVVMGHPPANVIRAD